MESSNYFRSLLVGLVSIGLVVLVIVLLIKAFTGGPATSNQVDITKYANTPATVTLLVDGPTGIDQDHSQVKITVSGIENEVDVMKGYQGTVVSSHTYANNSTAFGVFLQTLKLMNFARGKKGPADYYGYCPTGERYVYTFNDGTKNLFSYWSTSCGGQGTFDGNAPQVLQQFRLQIPQTDFDQLTGPIPLGF